MEIIHVQPGLKKIINKDDEERSFHAEGSLPNKCLKSFFSSEPTRFIITLTKKTKKKQTNITNRQN